MTAIFTGACGEKKRAVGVGACAGELAVDPGQRTSAAGRALWENTGRLLPVAELHQPRFPH